MLKMRLWLNWTNTHNQFRTLKLTSVIAVPLHWRTLISLLHCAQFLQMASTLLPPRVSFPSTPSKKVRTVLVIVVIPLMNVTWPLGRSCFGSLLISLANQVVWTGHCCYNWRPQAICLTRLRDFRGREQHWWATQKIRRWNWPTWKLVSV